MAVTNGYTTLVLLKAYLGISVSTYDTQLEAAINAASRAIDNYCGQRFWLDPTVTTRTFIATGSNLLLLPGGIGTASGLVVKTDPGGDGTFETTWGAGDYELRPVGAATAAAEAEPWTAIAAIGSLSFPTAGWGRSDRVQITAKFGWPAIPDAVAQACLIKAARLFHRKDSPQGIAGFGDFGPIRLSRDDGDFTLLLDPYRRVCVS